MVNRFLIGYKYRNESLRHDVLIMAIRKTDVSKVYMMVVWVDRQTNKASNKLEEIQVLKKDMKKWNIAREIT